jgi:hypothetical protein
VATVGRSVRVGHARDKGRLDTMRRNWPMIRPIVLQVAMAADVAFAAAVVLRLDMPVVAAVFAVRRSN